MEIQQIQEALNTKTHAVIGVTSGTTLSIWPQYLDLSIKVITAVYITTLVINGCFTIYKNIKSAIKKKK